MSLINKMLRDLDERHAPPVDRIGLPPAIHALPAPPDRSWGPVALLALVAVAGAAGAFYWYAELSPAPAAPVPVPVPKPIQPPPVPSPPVALPAAPVEPPPAVPAPEQKPEVPGEQKAADILPEPPKLELPPPAPPVAAVEPAAPAAKAAAAPAQKASAAKSAPVPRQEPPAEKSRPAPAAPVPKGKPAAEATGTAPSSPAAGRSAAAAEAEPVSIDKRPRSLPTSEAAESAYRKAMAAVRRGAVAEAVDGLRAALKLDSHHVSARQALLSLLVEQQQWDEARHLLEEGLAADPAQSSWAMALARLQLEQGKLPEAVDTLARHARHADQNADYQAFLALLLQKQKRGREAAERYRAALALKPAESRWWYGLGLVLDADQKPQEAREAFLKAKETGNLSPELAAAVDQKLK
ncbi:MAG: tetratricopeptide repeat protein [Sterolibacteriaceae bacterium MAG5]|nr:tetratricopeptide repeat protein [Candidatus Nitricoxidireducens bremensis]